MFAEKNSCIVWRSQAALEVEIGFIALAISSWQEEDDATHIKQNTRNRMFIEKGEEKGKRRKPG